MMDATTRLRVMVMDVIRRGGGFLSKKDLHKETGIPWGTMCKIADTLLSEGFISACRETPSRRGRPTVPFRVNPDSVFHIGIDVGSSQVKLVICDLAFNIVHRACHSTPPYAGESKFFNWLYGICDEALAGAEIPRGRLSGIGLAVSGIVDSEKGLIISGGNFGLSRGANLSIAKLGERFGVGACAMGTQVAAAWAEYHFGLKAGTGNLVTVGLGVGIGSGAVSNHQLLFSHPSRLVGYIGHLLMPGNPRVCVCGLKGCLEAYSGGNSLASIAMSEMPGWLAGMDAESLDRIAADGDAKAQAIMLKAASYNAAGIASMIQMYAPEAIVFSGGQSRSDGYLYRQTLNALKDALPAERLENISLSISSLGKHQSALGAARLAYERFF